MRGFVRHVGRKRISLLGWYVSPVVSPYPEKRMNSTHFVKPAIGFHPLGDVVARLLSMKGRCGGWCWL